MAQYDESVEDDALLDLDGSAGEEEDVKCCGGCFQDFYYAMKPEAEDRLNPVSAEAYRLILNYQGRYGDEQEDDEFLEEELKVRQDFAKNKVRWFGTFCRDFWIFMRNHYPPTEIIFSHPLFPVARWEFHVIFLLDICFSLWIAGIVTDTTACIACDQGCQDEASCEESEEDSLFGTSQVTKVPVWQFCCLWQCLGITWIVDNLTIQIGSVKFSLGELLICIVLGYLYMVLFFHLMHCNRYQHGSSEDRHRAKRIGYSTIIMLGIVLVVWCLPVTIVKIVYQGGLHLLGALLVTAGVSKLGTWFFEFFIKYSIFVCAFYRQSPGDDEDPGTPQERAFHTTAEEYHEFVDNWKPNAAE